MGLCALPISARGKYIYARKPFGRTMLLNSLSAGTTPLAKLPYVPDSGHFLLPMRIEFVRIEVGGPIRKESENMAICAVE